MSVIDESNKEEVEMRDQVMKDIANLHKENSLLGSLKKLTNTKEYQQVVEFQIPLHELYELVAACLHTQNADYCGTLVRIVDPKIIQLNKGLPFLI